MGRNDDVFTLWLGGLPRGTDENEIERFLKGFGRVFNIQVRSSPKDVFCFVSFEDPRDGEEAIEKLNQQRFLRSDNVVQMAKAGKTAKTNTKGPPPRRSPPRRSRSPPPRRIDSRPPSRSRRDDSRNRRPPPGPSNGRGEEINLWMGGLPRGVEEEEIRRFLKGYGDILSIRIRSGPKDVFAFATFTDLQGARMAVQDMDQKKFLDTDCTIQVRESNTSRPRRDQESYGGDDEKYRSARQTPAGRFRLKVQNIPPDMDWAELKDIARALADSVQFTTIMTESGVRTGIIEYSNKADAKHALKELDDRRMDGHDKRLRARPEDDWDR